ncbi:MAG: solute carrier family 26 protein [Bacteroidia bacterium]
MEIRKLIPNIPWIRQYRREYLPGDIGAGLTVGAMLIPQGMAYAMIAGLPPVMGLYAAMVPALFYSIFGTSRQLSVGPVAMESLLVAAGVGAIAEPGSGEYITLAFTLAFMVGLLQLLFGLLRMGFIVNFLSHPVISGFTSAAALVIGANQLKHLLGVNIGRSQYFYQIVIETFANAGNTHLLTLGMGIAGIVIIKLGKKYFPRIPGALTVVVLGTLATWGLGLDQYGVKILKDIPEGLPGLTLPALTVENIGNLFPIAIALVLIGFTESIAIGKAIAARHPGQRVVANRELIALGMANMSSGLFQGYPITGGLSRSAVNDQAGANTNLSSIIGSAVIMVTLLFLTPAFYFLPLVVLAAIILVAALGLVNIKEARYLWNANRTDFWMLAATFLATLFLGIQPGIISGVVLSLVMVIYRTSRPHTAVLAKVPGSTHYRNEKRFTNLETRTDLLIYRFDAELYFANIEFFGDNLSDCAEEKGEDLRAIIIHAESINYIDSSGIHGLKEIIENYQRIGLKIYFAAVKGPVRDAFFRAGLIEKIGKEHCFMDVQDAVDYHDGLDPVNGKSKFTSYTLQSN